MVSERRKLLLGMASAFHSSSATGTGRCGFCNKNHQSERCYGVLKLTCAEREEKVCGHVLRGCMSKCTKCKGYHILYLSKRCSISVPGHQGL